jgi:hypothetical protein
MGIAGRLPPENDVNFSGFFAVIGVPVWFPSSLPLETSSGNIYLSDVVECPARTNHA